MFDELKIWENRPAWLNNLGIRSDIALSSRIRLARNLRALPFPKNASQNKLDEVIIQMRAVVDEMRNLTFYPVHRLNPQQRLLLQEKRFVSSGFAKKTDHAAVALDSGGLSSIVVNDEDHIRLQVLDAGFNLDDLWQQIYHIDQLLERSLEYAFSQELGYLTSSPTNTGTGLRISLLFHLPALEIEGKLESVFKRPNFFELGVQGFYGEGSDVVGSIYQISNKLTLGVTEFALIDGFLKVGSEIVDKEQKARQNLYENRGIELEDKVYRSIGVLSHAMILSYAEFIEHYSNLLLGINLGLISDIDKQELHELLLWTQPAHLQGQYSKELTAFEKDVVRAEMVKTRLRI